ncbi:hypothetical protein M433DRAFT_143564 [Acidomyces richmondensis BFW]|nr:MAG: hypothetical protein FE78DRAFT_79519 [Acidomyces sp. 'richmondensis']KYG45852.1 hypothetical protein M433DRAFT_143564 [Acidomyces richmondensis BFW]
MISGFDQLHCLVGHPYAEFNALQGFIADSYSKLRQGQEDRDMVDQIVHCIDLLCQGIMRAAYAVLEATTVLYDFRSLGRLLTIAWTGKHR